MNLANDGSREIARRAIRAEVSATAMQLFVQRGFDEITITEVAAAAGVSRRSIFRYFPTKEDLVVGGMADVGQQLASALDARPVDEPAWRAMRRTFDTLLKIFEGEGELALARARMLASTPALQAALAQKHALWTELLAPGIAARIRGRAKDRQLRARAVVSAALACLDVAALAWTRSHGESSLARLLDDAMTAVGPL
jgi:AcrR family transcriptional regulator